MGGRRRDVRARRRSIRSRRRRSIRSRRRRSIRSRRRRSIRSRRRRSIRSGAGGRRVRVEARRYLFRVSGGRRDGHERARDRGKNERLSDVLQVFSFRGARAKASPRVWAEAVWLMPALKRAVLGQARQRRAKSARRVLPTDHGRGFRRPWRRSHAGPWIQLSDYSSVTRCGLTGTVENPGAFVILGNRISRFSNGSITPRQRVHLRRSLRPLRNQRSAESAKRMVSRITCVL
jgi:hypothetical protein